MSSGPGFVYEWPLEKRNNVKNPVNAKVTDDSTVAFVDGKSGKPISFVNIDWLISNIIPNRAGMTVIRQLQIIKAEAVIAYVNDLRKGRT